VTVLYTQMVLNCCCCSFSLLSSLSVFSFSLLSLSLSLFLLSSHNNTAIPARADQSLTQSALEEREKERIERPTEDWHVACCCCCSCYSCTRTLYTMPSYVANRQQPRARKKHGCMPLRLHICLSCWYKLRSCCSEWLLQSVWTMNYGVDFSGPTYEEKSQSHQPWGGISTKECHICQSISLEL
jgi:hypothetical protein